jgi:hypothetical protein
MFRLPVSGSIVRFRLPTGADEVALFEPDSDTVAATELARRLTIEGPLDWLDVAPTDLDAFLINLRCAVIGEHVRTDLACTAAGCGRRIDIAFRLQDYLANHSPEPPLRAIADSEPGWYHIAGARFRLVTIADQLAVEGLREPAVALAHRCIEPGSDWTDEVMRSVEGELERLAPNLAGRVSGCCPECGSGVDAIFDPRSYCISELRSHARFVFREVDLIARRYHWTERDILELPTIRRSTYADLARRPNGGS